MGRYVKDIVTGMDAETAEEIVSGFLYREGFEKCDYQGNKVWKKGQGFLMSPQYVELDIHQGKVHIEGWIRFALLPGVYAGEFGTEGTFLAVPKRKLKARIQQLEELLGQKAGPGQPHAEGG